MNFFSKDKKSAFEAKGNRAVDCVWAGYFPGGQGDWKFWYISGN